MPSKSPFEEPSEAVSRLEAEMLKLHVDLETIRRRVAAVEGLRHSATSIHSGPIAREGTTTLSSVEMSATNLFQFTSEIVKTYQTMPGKIIFIDDDKEVIENLRDAAELVGGSVPSGSVVTVQLVTISIKEAALINRYLKMCRAPATA
jgi:hypothetical protein